MENLVDFQRIGPLKWRRHPMLSNVVSNAYFLFECGDFVDFGYDLYVLYLAH